MALTKIQKIGVAGAGMFFFSILLQTAILPAAVNSQVRKKVALKEGWMMRGIWSKFPFIVEMRFYMYNVTNPDEIKAGEKPKLQEVGPYIYDEYHEKTNQVDNDEDDSITFNIRNTYFFNAEKSAPLTGEEEIIVPNYMILGLVNVLLREKPSVVPIVGKAVDSIYKKPSSIFVKAKVNDILFNGLPIDCTVKDFAGSAICTELRGQYQDFGLVKTAEDMYLLSLWATRNGTDSKEKIKVLRGLKNIMDVGKVVESGGKNNISVWDDDYCDTFNGTDGTVFHPFFDKKGNDDLLAFNQGLCRNVRCHFDSFSKTVGLKTLRYTTDLGTDGDNNPLQKCFCETPDKCLKKGAYDAFKCVKLPLIVTNPHFYMADEYYLSMVEGLNPDKEKHAIVIDLDPFTGSPLHANTRAQFNMLITKVEKFKLMKTFPDALLPLFWIDEIIDLPDFLIKEIKGGHRLYALGKMFKHLMMFGGLGLCGFAGFKHFKSMQAENKLNGKKTVVANKGSKPSTGEKKMEMNISTLQPAPVPPTVD